MKKRLFLIASAALVLAACAKEEAYQFEESPIAGRTKISIGASFELPESGATKSDIDDDGNFTWATTDAIWIGSDYTLEHGNTFTLLEIDKTLSGEIGPGYINAKFSGYLSGRETAVAAISPAITYNEDKPDYNAEPRFSENKLYVSLPKARVWKQAQVSSLNTETKLTRQADNLLIARYEDIYDGGYAHGTTEGLKFKNAGGLFRLELAKLPLDAKKVVFTTDKKITGEFLVEDTVEKDVHNNDVHYPVINTSETSVDEEKSVSFDILVSDSGNSDRVLFIPVPVGKYKIGFKVLDGEDKVLWEFSTSRSNTVRRGHMVIMPPLTFVTVGGSGEGATNIIVTPEGYTGTVYLPSTENNIYVRMHGTTGPIDIAYSQNGDLKPANVYLQALGDITTLNINLPYSHVELTGTDENNVQVVTNLTASTSINTFVVDNKVQIGKTTDNEETVGGLTINGGSLDLSAPVVGPVTVVYDVVSETVNKTSEKVSINIKSAIKDLVVTSAYTQTAPDKIYVTLSSSSEVKETLSVPETNCNLYIAPNAQVKTVTTSAAENTVAGKVENLAATGEGTSVVVEKKGSITGSISSTDKASIVIVERTQKEVNEQTAGVITTNTSTKDQGTINTVADTAVAMIGGESYSTLAGAFAAVVDGQTIKLISDVTLEETFVVALGEKTVTLDLGGRTLTGRTNLTSGKLTLKNGNVVNTGGQPLNVYGSETPGAKNCSVLSVARDVTVTGNYGVCVFGKTATTNGYGAVVNVEGKLIANDGIFVSGNLGNNVADDMNNIVNISGTITSESDVAVALNGWATVNVQSGAKITGNTGIAVKRGVLNVYDGATVTANGQWVTPPAANNSGTEPTGAAVSMTNTYNHLGAMAVNIAGGSFTSANGEALYKADQDYSKNAATFTVTGGSFSSDPTAYLAPGYTTSGSNPWTVVKLEGAVTNLAELQDAITNNVTPIYYVGDAITEAFTLAPSAATVINGLKVNHQTVAAKATTLTINGDVTLNKAEITTKAYCGISVSEGKTVTLKDCVVDGSSATATDCRAMDINGRAVVTIDGSTIKGSATAGYSRCLNILDDGAKLDVINGSTLSVSHYAVNMPPSTVNAVVNVEDSSVNTAWAITNIWKTGNTINLTNCTLNSVNDKNYDKDGWNNFSAFVFNNDGTNISSGNVLTVNNCTVNVSSTTGNRQSLISMRGNNDTIKFIGSDSTIALAENGGITYQWGQLHSTLNNTLSFDKANYNQISESIDAACVVTNANNLYTISYVTEVYYYWFLDDVEDGVYCSLADPFESSSLILSNGEYIRLEKNIALTKNITVTLSDYLTAGNYFTMQFGDYTITKGNYSIILPAGLSVKTDKKTDVFTGANGAMIVETVSNNEYTYTAVQSVAQIGSSYYATIADAVAAANKSGNVTIKLLRDYDFEANEPGYGYTTSFLAEGESTARDNMLVVSGNSITFDLGGHTISNLFNNTFNVTGKNVVFQNGEMRVGQLYYSSLNGTVYTSENDRTCSYIVYVTNATNFTVNNLTTYGGINVSGSTATINDLSFSGTKFYAVCSQSNSAVTLNGGTYTKAISGATGNLFWIEDGSRMNITGGTYTKGKANFITTGAKPVITGGTFDFNPSAYVAPGYEAVLQSGNNWKVQVKNYTCTVYTPSTNLSGSLDAPVVSRVRKDEAVVNFGSFSNLEAGQVIELTEDAYYNGTVSIPAGVVLDFNGHKLTATKVRGLNGNAILQNTLPYNDGQPNMDAYVNVSYEGDVENVEIRGGTYTFNPQTYTPSGIGVVVDGTSYNAPGLYFVPSIPEALVYYADYNFISTNLGEVTIGYNGSFGKDEYGNISSTAGTFEFGKTKKSESINDAFIFQMNPQEEYATSQSYNNWICDYVVSVKEGENGTPEEPGLGLWGMYGGMTVGFGIGFNLAANEKYPLISSLGFNFDYTGIKTTVSTFICGTLPFNDDLIGKTVYVDLCLFPAEGFDSSKVNKDQNYKYIVVKRFEYKFAAE